jgi:Mce-associated membrane protein
VSLQQRIRTFGPVVAAALCVPCIVLLTLFTWRLHTRDAVDTSRSGALRAARTTAVTLLGYDYRHIADNVAAAKKVITKPFSTQYAETADSLQTEAVRLKAIVEADVKTAAIIDAGVHRVVVLLFVDQASVKQLPGQSKPVSRVDEQRVRLTLVDTKGRWLVSEVAALI